MKNRQFWSKTMVALAVLISVAALIAMQTPGALTVLSNAIPPESPCRISIRYWSNRGFIGTDGKSSLSVILTIWGIIMGLRYLLLKKGSLHTPLTLGGISLLMMLLTVCQSHVFGYPKGVAPVPIILTGCQVVVSAIAALLDPTPKE